MASGMKRFLGIALALLKGQIFLFPKLNTIRFRIYGRLRVRGHKKKLELGRNVTFLGDAVLVLGWDHPTGSLKIGDKVILEHGCYVNVHGGSITIEENAFIGVHSVIQGKGGVTIRKDTLLGPNTQIYSSDHPTYTNILPRRDQQETSSPINIGEDVWVGASSIILRGSDISSGSVVAAGSIVRTKTKEPVLLASKNTVAVPIRSIKSM